MLSSPEGGAAAGLRPLVTRRWTFEGVPLRLGSKEAACVSGRPHNMMAALALGGNNLS